MGYQASQTLKVHITLLSTTLEGTRHLESRIKNGRSKSLRAEAPEEGPVTQSHSRVPYRQRFAVLRAHTHDHFHVPLRSLVVFVKVAL